MRLILCALTVFFLIGCRTGTLDELDFFTVKNEVQSVSVLSLNDVLLRGKVEGLSLAADSCGFVWSFDKKTVEGLSSGLFRLRAQVPESGDGTFESVFPAPVLNQGRTFYFRAFTASGDRIMYAPFVDSYTLGEIVSLLPLPDTAGVYNNEARVKARLSGQGILIAKVTSHGFVYSSVNPFPELGKPDCFSKDRLAYEGNYIYSDTLRGLKFNTTYYFRAYAISNDTTWHSRDVQAFRVRDGWERVGLFQPYRQGSMVFSEWTQQAYLGFGCDKKEVCPVNELPRTFYAFNPLNNPGDPLKPEAEVSTSITQRTNAASFSIGSYLYFIGGQYFSGQPGLLESYPAIVHQFCRYDLLTQQWTKLPDPQADVYRRSGAVAFVLNDKAYVGGGKRRVGLDPTNTAYLYTDINDFWEYDPNTQKWRRMAPLPLKLSATDLPDTVAAGRFDAVSFVIGNYAYVGGGETGLAQLKDFWRFTPPELGNPADQGRWDYVSHCPASGRVDAVGFAIGSRGYYGTGLNNTDGDLRDFWELNPGTGKWRERTPFQGGERRQSLSYSDGTSGYLGWGVTKVLDNTGNFFTDLILRDVWHYIPEKP